MSSFKTPNDKKFGTVTANTVKTVNLEVSTISSLGSPNNIINIDGPINFGDFTVDDLTVTGNTVLGNAAADSLVVNATTVINGTTTTINSTTEISAPLSVFGSVRLGDSFPDAIQSYSSPVIRGFEVNSSIATGGTMTAAQLIDGIITVDTSGGAGNIQLPTAADLDAGFFGAPPVGTTFHFHIVQHNHGTNAATVTTNTGWTLLTGAAVVVVGPKDFVARRTGVATWSLF